MRWEKNRKDSLTNQQYYAQKGEFTLCKVGTSKVTFELWHKSINMGIFTNQLDALNKFKEVTK